MAQAPIPVEVFCCYSHADEVWLRKLEDHLSPLRQQGLISLWHDRLIAPGVNWARTIDTHLETASIILLLVSADFLASEYCYSVEMKRALEREAAGEARVVPILVRPVDWKGTPFAHLQALPTNAKPLSTWKKQETALASITAGILRAIEDVPRLSATDLSPIWTIPYSRNPFFLGRDGLLSQIHSQLQAGQVTALSQPQAINGLGGVGKTQIAVEYACQHCKDYQAVLWIYADTQDSLVSGYVAIARRLNLPEKDEQNQTEVVQAVKQWLSDHTGWLLILDNADELKVAYEFLPSAPKGHILLTTRAHATGTRANRIEVESMLPDVGALFLLRRAKLLALNAQLADAAVAAVATAREICVEMGGLPLALDQAGAYIEETQCGLTDYQQLYRTRRALLLKRRGDLADDDHPESVATTLSLSFEKVEQKCPPAGALLRLCAFLSSDPIPEEIITHGVVYLGEPPIEPDLLREVAFDEELRDKAIAALGAYSLIHRNPRTQTLLLHRLVQAVARDALPAQEGREWMLRAILAVAFTFPKVKFGQWAVCERWIPHALVCATWIKREQLIFPLAASMLNDTGSYLNEQGKYEQAEPLLKQALSIREQQLRPGHSDIAESLNNLGWLYFLQGKDEQAEPLLKRALLIFEQDSGPEHPDTVQILTNLAALYEVQGKYAEAEPLLERVLATQEQYLGSGHLDTAPSLNHLANLYEKWEKYEKAESLYLRALAIYQQQLGAHPDTALCFTNLATLSKNQGEYWKTALLYRTALAIYEQMSGPMHPEAVTPLNNLGSLYADGEEYEEAELLYLRALSITEQRFAPEHPDTAQSLNNLGRLYDKWGKYEQAEGLYVRALSIREQQLRPEHPDIAESLNNLGWLHARQGKYEQAEPLLKRALTIREQQLGIEHSNTGTSLSNLARLYQAQGKDEEAKRLFKRELSLFELQFGSEHLYTQAVRGAYALLLGLDPKDL